MNPGDAIRTRSGFYGVVAEQPKDTPDGYTAIELNGYCGNFFIQTSELSLV